AELGQHQEPVPLITVEERSAPFAAQVEEGRRVIGAPSFFFDRRRAGAGANRCCGRCDLARRRTDRAETARSKAGAAGLPRGREGRGEGGVRGGRGGGLRGGG